MEHHSHEDNDGIWIKLVRLVIKLGILFWIVCRSIVNFDSNVLVPVNSVNSEPFLERPGRFALALRGSDSKIKVQH
ncbi:hypothetical protein CFP56_029769 [Quercus suber]|uniref:Transmembrane protein n=1 Tax=Quercus suber TaxID=58331 RepID=A0AAW0LVM1_QUESU